MSNIYICQIYKFAKYIHTANIKSTFYLVCCHTSCLQEIVITNISKNKN